MNLSLRSVIEDPDFTSDVTVRHDQSADSNDDGRVEFELSAPESMELLIVSPDPESFEIVQDGQVDDTDYLAYAMIDSGLGEDDRILWDDGFGETAYRAVEVEAVDFDGEQFARYRLIEDSRGEPVNDDSSSDGGVR
ncbi:hypothetical protein [Halocatena halophila]|uniref:hypothetical protein n=1 Tax=Halocatena halophila TaxID=2814576 RepID=UPI002ED04050